MLLGLQWWWWLVGTVGIGGAVAFVLLAPAAAGQLFASALKFLIGTRVGIGLLVGVVVWFASDTYRSNADQALWNKRIASFEQAQKERDAKIDADARAQVLKEVADEKAAEAGSNKEVKDYEQALPVLPASDTACRVGDDADKLRHIAGQPAGKRKLRLPALGRKRAGT